MKKTINIKSIEKKKDIVHELKIGKYHVNIHSHYDNGILKQQFITDLSGKIDYRAYPYPSPNMMFYMFKPGVDLNKLRDQLKDFLLIEPENITQDHLEHAYCYYEHCNGFNYKLGQKKPLPRYATYEYGDNEYIFDKKEINRLKSIGVDYKLKSNSIYSYTVNYVHTLKVYEAQETIDLLIKHATKHGSYDLKHFVAKRLGLKKIKSQERCNCDD